MDTLLAEWFPFENFPQPTGVRIFFKGARLAEV